MRKDTATMTKLPATNKNLATEESASVQAVVDPSDLLTPHQLAARLQVDVSWVFEQTWNRAKVRTKNPLPCIRLGKYLRFSWVQVCEWMTQNSR